MKRGMKTIGAFVCAVVLLAVINAQAEETTSKTLPPNNPFLIQNSAYPSVHFNSAQTDATTLPVWQGDVTIEPLQVEWLPGVTTMGTVHRQYSGGEHAVFFSGGNRVGKIRITWW